MKLTKFILLAVVALWLAPGASRAATVIGTIQTAGGTPLVGQPILFTPLSPLVVSNVNVVVDIAQNASTAADGGFTNVFIGGFYNINVVGRAALRIFFVPTNDTNTYNLGTLLNTQWTGPGGGGATTFDLVGGGVNTTAAMTVGNGATLGASGTGSITATAGWGTAGYSNAVSFVRSNEVNAVTVTNAANKLGGDISLGTGLTAGQIPAIAESGVTSLVGDLSGKAGTNETRAVVITNAANKLGGDISLGTGLTAGQIPAIAESGVTSLVGDLSARVQTNETRAVVITNAANKLGGDISLGTGLTAGQIPAIAESGVTSLVGDLSGKSGTNETRVVIHTNAANQMGGDGSLLTALNGSSVGSGTVGDARLSSNVPLKNGANVMTGSNTLSGTLDFEGAAEMRSTNSAGTSGQVWTSAGTGKAPYWTTVSGGGGSLGATNTSGELVLTNDLQVPSITTSGTLPTAVTNAGASTTATVGVIGTDMSGSVILTNTGTAGSANATVFTLTFSKPVSATARLYVSTCVYPGQSVAAAAGAPSTAYNKGYSVALTTTNWTIATVTGQWAVATGLSAISQWNWLIVQ